MTHFTRIALAPLLVVSPLFVACGSDAPTSITANLDISSPANNSVVNVPAAPQAQTVAVTFSTNWTLHPKGQCTGVDHCGHVWVTVDGSGCNASGVTYNTVADASPASADLSKCPTVLGQHTIKLELRDDADVVVKNLVGDNVSASVTITAQ